ncbi:uncharacterized protein LOC135104434 [Scylla paramamosain]|uniref:uncharacterized protein LOC135104434 n=1 Tax=Scylla paramamosain TaxID=85552 RepID=UPI003083594D
MALGITTYETPRPKPAARISNAKCHLAPRPVCGGGDGGGGVLGTDHTILTATRTTVARTVTQGKVRNDAVLICLMKPEEHYHLHHYAIIPTATTTAAITTNDTILTAPTDIITYAPLPTSSLTPPSSPFLPSPPMHHYHNGTTVLITSPPPSPHTSPLASFRTCPKAPDGEAEPLTSLRTCRASHPPDLPPPPPSSRGPHASTGATPKKGLPTAIIRSRPATLRVGAGGEEGNRCIEPPPGPQAVSPAVHPPQLRAI